MRPGIESGILKVKEGVGRGKERAYSITALEKSDLPQVMALQDIIVQHLHCSSLLEPFSSEFMCEHLGKRGFVLGVFSGGDLVGFRNVYFPAAHDSEWNLGRDIGLSGAQLEKVANLQMICVHPDYRGNGLALKMNRLALQILRERGSHDHICATVSPQNIWNLPVLLASGFHIRRLKLKYGGKLRFIAYKRLKTPVHFYDTPVAKVPLNALDTHKQLLDAGYYAVDLVPISPLEVEDATKACRYELVFRRPVSEPGVYMVPRRSAPSATPNRSRHADDSIEEVDLPRMSDITDGDEQQ